MLWCSCIYLIINNLRGLEFWTKETRTLDGGKPDFS